MNAVLARALSAALLLANTALPAIGQGITHTEIRMTERGSISARAAPTRIEVFANSAMLIANAGNAEVYLLDGLQMLEAELSQGLPGNERDAMPILQQRLRASAPAIQARATQSGAGLMQAQGYGLERVPAVVFDGRVTVYGVTDVAQALAAYSRGQGVAVQTPRFLVQRR